MKINLSVNSGQLAAASHHLTSFIIFIFLILITMGEHILFASMIKAEETKFQDITSAQSTQNPPPSSRSGSLSLSMEEAILLALKRNKDLQVKIIDPKIGETIVEESRSLFDMNLSAQLSTGKNKDISYRTKEDILNQFPLFAPFISDKIPEGTQATDQTTQRYEGEFKLSKLFSTGTKLDLEFKNRYLDYKTIRSDSDEESSSSGNLTSGGITLTQPLLQGMGKKVNLSLIEESELDRQISIHELRQYVIELIAKVQKNYWDLILAKETLNIHNKSLELANQQLIETQERINVGKQAESELVAAQAEVAEKKRKVIDARSSKDQKKLDLILLLNPDPDPELSPQVNIFWDQNISLTTTPTIEIPLRDTQDHIAEALKYRPALKQAYLNLQKGDLEVIRTQNGLLPKLDFFFTLKRMADGSQFPDSFDEFENYDYIAGLVLSHPLGKRKENSEFNRANLNRLKYQESIEYLKQNIQVEVRKALLEIERYHEQIIASEASRKMQEEKLKVEQEKFRLGRSTNLMVFQAQRDLVESQVNEVTAIINHLKAFIDLKIAEGTLLEPWSIEIIPPLAGK